MELLTVVLTILADGGFALQCPVIADNKEIYLEGAEAVEFLGKRKRKHHKNWVRAEKRSKKGGGRKVTQISTPGVTCFLSFITLLPILKTWPTAVTYPPQSGPLSTVSK